MSESILSHFKTIKVCPQDLVMILLLRASHPLSNLCKGLYCNLKGTSFWSINFSSLVIALLFFTCEFMHSLMDSRVENSKFIDSKIGFFSNFFSLLIQVQILVIFCVNIIIEKLYLRCKHYDKGIMYWLHLYL